jgi:hypothetical protein
MTRPLAASQAIVTLTLVPVILYIVQAHYKVGRLFIEAAFHQNGFSSKWFFIECSQKLLSHRINE